MLIPADKYCTLVEAEGGLRLLHDLMVHPNPYERIKKLANIVIVNCARYAARYSDESPLPSPEM